MSDLRLIKKVTGTSVSAINVLDVFTSDFDVYKIVAADMVGATSTATGTNLRLINSSGTVIASNYLYAMVNMKSESGYSDSKSTSETRIWNVFASIDDGGQGSGGVVYIFNPTSTSHYTNILYESAGYPSGNLRGFKGWGKHKVYDTITGFQIENNENVAFVADAKISVYGLRV